MFRNKKLMKYNKKTNFKTKEQSYTIQTWNNKVSNLYIIY